MQMLYFLYHIRARLILEQWLLFKVIFAWKYIKIIIFLFLKNLLLTSARQNNMKTPKIINLKQII
jgi:hypothetical protein